MFVSVFVSVDFLVGKQFWYVVWLVVWSNLLLSCRHVKITKWLRSCVNEFRIIAHFNQIKEFLYNFKMLLTYFYLCFWYWNGAVMTQNFSSSGSEKKKNLNVSVWDNLFHNTKFFRPKVICLFSEFIYVLFLQLYEML